MFISHLIGGPQISSLMFSTIDHDACQLGEPSRHCSGYLQLWLLFPDSSPDLVRCGESLDLHPNQGFHREALVPAVVAKLSNSKARDFLEKRPRDGADRAAQIENYDSPSVATALPSERTRKTSQSCRRFECKIVVVIIAASEMLTTSRKIFQPKCLGQRPVSTCSTMRLNSAETRGRVEVERESDTE